MKALIQKEGWKGREISSGHRFLYGLTINERRCMRKEERAARVSDMMRKVLTQTPCINTLSLRSANLIPTSTDSQSDMADLVITVEEYKQQ